TRCYGRRYCYMRRHPFAVAAAIVAGLVVAAVIFVIAFNFKGIFDRRASAALGRTVTVSSAHIRLFPLRFVLKDLDVAGDAGAAPMMTAGTIDATVAFWPLFSHRYIFPRLIIEHSKTVMARDANGALNWQAGAKPAEYPEKTGDVPKL